MLVNPLNTKIVKFQIDKNPPPKWFPKWLKKIWENKWSHWEYIPVDVSSGIYPGRDIFEKP